MIGKDVTNNGSVSLHDVSEILENRRKEKEPSYEQEIALEHSKKFNSGKSGYDKMIKKLGSIKGLKQSIISKIADIKPANDAILKQILASEKVTLDESTLKEIIGIVKESE